MRYYYLLGHLFVDIVKVIGGRCSLLMESIALLIIILYFLIHNQKTRTTLTLSLFPIT